MQLRASLIFQMPRTFSGQQGRRPDPRLFPVRTDESGEPTNAIPDWLGIDLHTWLNHLLVDNDNVGRECTPGGAASGADHATAPPPQQPRSLSVPPSAPSPEAPAQPPPEEGEPPRRPEHPSLPTMAAPHSLPAPPPAQATGIVHASVNLCQPSPLQFPAVLPPAYLAVGIPTSATLAACQLAGPGATQALSPGITRLATPVLPATHLGAVQLSTGVPMKRSASFMDDGQTSTEGESPESPGTPYEPTPFTWSSCRNLISTDAVGVLVRQPSAWPVMNVQLQLQLQLPLLFWAERRRWMWHKKWTLPKLHVRVTCDGRRGARARG